MKVIFTDVDGVLNDGKSNTPDNCYNINRDCLDCLINIVRNTGASVVLTYAGRLGMDIKHCRMSEEQENLVNMFKQEHIDLIGKTPVSLTASKEDEIEQWLNSHRQVDKFIVLDTTEYDLQKYKYTRLLKVNGGKGLNSIAVKRAIDMLK